MDVFPNVVPAHWDIVMNNCYYYSIGILYIGYYDAWYIATENESPIEVSKLIITRYNSTIIIILMIIIQYYTITTHLIVCFNN